MNSEKLKQRLQRIGKELDTREIQFNLLMKQKEQILSRIQTLTEREKVLSDTSILLQEASLYSRMRIKNDLEKVVSSALQEILSDPNMWFHIEYGSAHNKVTCSFFLLKKVGNETMKLDIMNECGGGVADIISIAIRVVLLLYHSRDLTKLLMLDEACTSISNFSGEVLSNLGKWMRMVSEKFDIQIILVTQKQELAAFSHKQFSVEMDSDGVSVVRDA